VHLTLSDRTRALVGAAELALMRPTAVLINTSRGPIVDEAALIEALTTDRLAGAALDVFDVEPLPLDHPLSRLRNVVLTPHIGYVTERCYRIFYDEIVDDIAAWLKGAPVRVLT
jgi:phosphoglycerate dehydrogenase-like enzyme